MKVRGLRALFDTVMRTIWSPQPKYWVIWRGVWPSALAGKAGCGAVERRPSPAVERRASSLINDWTKRGAGIGGMSAYTAAFTRGLLVLH
jgi:hypothetical protein